jgi:hypothetical protein
MMINRVSNTGEQRVPSYEKEYLNIYGKKLSPLLDRYTLADITKALRINTSQIKDNLNIRTNINFAEARIDVPGGLFHCSILSQLIKTKPVLLNYSVRMVLH